GAIPVVLEKTNDQWYKINYQGKVGYISTDYITHILTAENFDASGVVTGNSVRIRSGPSTDNDIITTCNSGTKLNVVGINNGWNKFDTSSGKGYIRSDLFKITGAASSTNQSTDPDANLSGSTPTPTGNSAKGNSVANLALKYVGYPYVYGAESPSSGFDCSGLVYYCYGQYGYSLSRTASQQYRNNGVAVSKSELQAGDLVFFSSNGSSVTHVGIYIGDGYFVHASTPSVGVIVSSLSSSYYTRVWYGAKRIV
ncbi:MAG: C40 family peptidase, partial [Oscillospiraceae bacterium]|nr:C40 family peptidase [Oscillospiraceae bacterium]